MSSLSASDLFDGVLSLATLNELCADLLSLTLPAFEAAGVSADSSSSIPTGEEDSSTDSTGGKN